MLLYQWNYEGQEYQVDILESDKFQDHYPDLYETFRYFKFPDTKICKAIFTDKAIVGSLVIPKKQDPIKQKDVFAFCIADHRLIFIDDKNVVKHILQEQKEEMVFKLTTPIMFLLNFMSRLIDQDAYYLEGINEKLERIELDLYEGIQEDEEKFIMQIRREMNIMSNYYMQLGDMTETLRSLLVQTNNQTAISFASLYSSRISQLQSLVNQVLDYTSQIWNLKQTYQSNKQNEISTVLTITSVIFLPLTLVTGWFGMNFTKMNPFISTYGGYYGTIAFCVIVFIAELVYIRIKKLWK